MIFVDANIFMYAAGADHPNRKSSIELLRAVANRTLGVASSVEVLQEILYRYRSIGRWAEGSRLYDDTRLLLDVIYDVTVDDLDRARALLDDHPVVTLWSSPCMPARLGTE